MLLRLATRRGSRFPSHRPLSSFQSESGPKHDGHSGAREFKVVLDNDTLYVDTSLAEALGWTSNVNEEGVPLTLRGWAPHYFAITRVGSDSGQYIHSLPLHLAPITPPDAVSLSRNSVQSSRDPKVQEVLDYLKNL